MKKIKLHIIQNAYCRGCMVLMICGSVISCQQSQDQEAIQALIKAKIEERVANYARIKREKCFEKVLKEASRQADSILLVEARLNRDTLLKPPKPIKPEKPEILSLTDSSRIAPFLTPPVDTLPKPDSIHE